MFTTVGPPTRPSQGDPAPRDRPLAPLREEGDDQRDEAMMTTASSDHDASDSFPATWGRQGCRSGSAMLVSMPDGIEYSAASAVIEGGLAGDGSAFTPGRPVWTADAASELMRFFVDAPLLGSDSFTAKLAGQLREASAEAVQLRSGSLIAPLGGQNLLPRPSDLGR